ncbi:hypothetical protein L596_008675 [Steinernema carpocapsae]|uniref:Uncharacterized protein n=1 Tax=Steinernema carpocapsae TaxID=34508 RepID=A0A4U5PDH8_STECR|nr:hypothetical protein L596_008675 [Steinernema carpocapsae]
MTSLDEIMPGLMRNRQRQVVMREEANYDYEAFLLPKVDENLSVLKEEEVEEMTERSSTLEYGTEETATEVQARSTSTTVFRPLPELPEAVRIKECTQGIWSEWFYSEESKCSADCGGCGRKIRRRNCATLQNGCPCIGLSEDRVPCNIGVCQYPNPSCCLPFSLIYVNGSFACGPQNEQLIDEFVNGIPKERIVSRLNPRRRTF